MLVGGCVELRTCLRIGSGTGQGSRAVTTARRGKDTVGFGRVEETPLGRRWVYDGQLMRLSSLSAILPAVAQQRGSTTTDVYRGPFLRGAVATSSGRGAATHERWWGRERSHALKTIHTTTSC